MPSKVEPKSQVDRSKFTLSYSALARAHVIGPLGGLGGVGMDVDVGRFTSLSLLLLNLMDMHCVGGIAL